MMAFPKTSKEVREVVDFANKTEQKLFVLGNGSNTLFDDEGFDGIVLNTQMLNKIRYFKTGVYVGSGTKLFYLNIKLCQAGLSGLEWSYGIPGSVGGAVLMNCGSFENDISNFVCYVDVLKNGKIVRLKRQSINFAYRFSGLYDCVILGVRLKLKQDNPSNIERRMNFFFDKKKALQPYEVPSLGSVFKHTIIDGKTVFPAKMIDNMGLKGVKIGGIEISKKHAGFFVSDGTATAKDFKQMTAFVENKMKEKGITLEREVVFLKK